VLDKIFQVIARLVILSGWGCVVQFFVFSPTNRPRFVTLHFPLSAIAGARNRLDVVDAVDVWNDLARKISTVSVYGISLFLCLAQRVFGILKDYISEGYTAILRRSWGHTFIMLKKFNLRRSIQPNKKSFKTKNCI